MARPVLTAPHFHNEEAAFDLSSKPTCGRPVPNVPIAATSMTSESVA